MSTRVGFGGASAKADVCCSKVEAPSSSQRRHGRCPPCHGTSFTRVRANDRESSLVSFIRLPQAVSLTRPHLADTKTIVALHRPGLSPPDDYKPEGWIYIGSHNLYVDSRLRLRSLRGEADPAFIAHSTPSAWGNLQCPASRGPGIAMANYEMGVILPIRGATMAEVEAKATALATYRRPLVPVRRLSHGLRGPPFTDSSCSTRRTTCLGCPKCTSKGPLQPSPNTCCLLAFLAPSRSWSYRE